VFYVYVRHGENGVAKAVRHKKLFNFMIKGASHSLGQRYASTTPASPNQWNIEIEKEARQYICFFDSNKKPSRLYQFLASKFFVLEILYSKSLQK
jgi:hypothetical protein